MNSAERHPFAPGVIEPEPPRPASPVLAAIQVALWCAAWLGALSAAGGLLAGYLVGRGWL